MATELPWNENRKKAHWLYVRNLMKSLKIKRCLKFFFLLTHIFPFSQKFEFLKIKIKSSPDQAQNSSFLSWNLIINHTNYAQKSLLCVCNKSKSLKTKGNMAHLTSSFVAIRFGSKHNFFYVKAFTPGLGNFLLKRFKLSGNSKSTRWSRMPNFNKLVISYVGQ